MAEHTLKINAELDTSGLQGRLDQLNRNKGPQPGTGAGGTLAQQLSKLDRTLMRLEQAVNRLGRGQAGSQPARTGQVVVGGMAHTGGAFVLAGGRTPMNSALGMAKGILSRGGFSPIEGWAAAEMVKAVAPIMPSQTYKNIYELARSDWRRGPWYRPSTWKAGFDAYRLYKAAPDAALGRGSEDYRNMLVNRRVSMPPGAARQLGGMAVGAAFAPVLDYMSNNVFTEPATWGHALTKVGKGVVQGGATGAFIGFGAGTATTGAGGAPGAAIGAVIGGLIGGVHGIVEALQDVKQYELRTAEDLKRYNDQIRSNWKKIADAFPKA